MYCTKCGVELRETDRFCCRCGVRTGVDPAPTYGQRSLMLDKRNKKIGGVCAGFARYFEADLILIRVLWLVIAFSTGIGFLAYLAAWIVMPSDRGLDYQTFMQPRPQAS